ncbi:MAG TPA: ABC transporter permease [Candidatus Dormibacteraeota bacterium]
MRSRSVSLNAFLAAVLLFMVAPIAIVIVNSFNSVAYGAWPPPRLSTRWYQNLADQPGFGDAAVLSVEIGIVATALALVAGGLAAMALVRYSFPGRSAVNAFLLSPMLVPKVSIGLAAFMLFLRIRVYGSFPSLVVAHTVLILPFMVTIIASGLVRVDRRLEEAALDLGASSLRVLWHVTLPQIRRSLVAALVLSFVISFDEVDATIFMVSPRQPTLPVAMYTYMQKFQDPTLAALSTVLIAATFVLAAVAFRSFGLAGFTQAMSRRAAESD